MTEHSDGSRSREAAIRLAAAEWIVRLDAGTVSEAERETLKAWLAADPAHRRAFQAAQAGWDELSGLGRYGLRATMALEEGRPATNRVRWLQAGGALAAAAALAVIGLGVLRMSEPTGTENASFSSAVGEQRRISTPDGSVILLNTNSRAEVRFSDDVRAVALLQGEAFFEVAKDPDRPFRVDTSSGSVTAVGTAFAVSLVGSAVQVAVTEGKVAVSPLKAAERSSPIELAVGETVLIASTQLLTPVRQELEQLERKLSWRTGTLEFEAEPLGEVVREVSRYTDLQIEIADAELEGRRFGGAFPVGDVDALLGALPVYGVKVERVAPNHIRLTAQPA